MKSRVWLYLLGASLALASLLWLGFTRFQPYAFHGTVIQSPMAAPEFELMSSSGQKVKRSDFQGKLMLIYFGYTFCPDVCPTTLAEVKRAMDELGKDAGQVQVIMISVDPERDTPQRLNQYLRQFDANFLGLTGDLQQIAEVAALYGIYFEKHEGSAATDYSVDHTASLLVLDAQGHLKLVLPYGVTGKDIASDLRYLLKH